MKASIKYRIIATVIILAIVAIALISKGHRGGEGAAEPQGQSQVLQ